MGRILIFANGELADAGQARSLIQPTDMIVCADGGTRHALALGLQPDVVVGDLDSIGPEDRAQLLASGVQIQRHSQDKNETDLELAIRFSIGQDPSSILIIAALGRRLDHTLGNIALLSAPELVGMDIRLDDGLEETFFCRAQADISGARGDLISLIPWGDAVEGVDTEGLRWSLHGETLYPDKTRGISNEMLDTLVRIHIHSGLLLLVHRRQR